MEWPGAAQFGVGLRRGHFDQVMAGAAMPDFFEIVPEAFLGVGGRAALALDAARARRRITAHGVSLNLGSPDPLARERLNDLVRFLDVHQIEAFSDHLCASAIDGTESFDLLPVPFHPAMVEHIVARGRAARAILGRPLGLENITAYAHAPGSIWTEGEFTTHVLDELDAGLLLDVANVVVNARNQRVPARTLLDALPLHRTVQIHLAGHRYDPTWKMTVDDHASAISNETMDLYRYALLQIGKPVPTLVEWDQQLPSYETLLAEAERAREVAYDTFREQRAATEILAHG